MATTTPQTTYFGDVNVYGNTTMSGTLAVLGTPALFISNLGVATDRFSAIGTQSIPFQYAWMTAANTTSVNFLTNIPGPIGVATTASGATVTVQGNVVVSNSVSTTNVKVVTSINTGSVMNVNFLTGPGGVGVGTNVVGAAALAVLGTMNAVTRFQAANLVLSGTLNVVSANIFSIATSNVGVGTTPVTGGATLAIQGFATVSNSLTTTNVYVTTANVGTINTGALVNSSGFVGVGTSAASGTNMWVLGDLGSSNAIVAPVMTSNGLIASGRINVATLVAQSNVGIGGAPDQGGAALEVTGNVFLSNTFTTPQVFAGFMNVSNRSNIFTGLATSNVLIGPASDQYMGFNLAVDGNVVVSNALQTTGVTADSLINVGSSANLLAIMSPFSLGVSNPINGAGAFFSLDSTYDDTAVVPSFTTAPTVLSGTPAFIAGAGPAAQAALNLPIASLRWDSTSVVAAVKGFTMAGWVYFNSAFSAGTTPLFEVYTPLSGGGGNSWYAAVYIRRVTANYYWSVEFKLSGKGTDTINTTTQPVAGQWYHVALTLSTARVMTLYVNGVSRGSISIASAGSWPTSGETNPQNFYLGDAPDVGGSQISTRYSGIGLYPTVLSQGQISSLYSSGTFAQPALAQYGISGNLYASNTLTIFNANSFTSNAARSSNVVSITARTSVGVGTAADATGNTELLVRGNAFISNSLTTANVYATISANTVTLNTTSIFTGTGFLGISTTAPSGTALYIPGNVFVSNSFTGSRISVLNSNSLSANSVGLNATTNVGIGTVAPVSTFWTPTAGLTTVLPAGVTGAYQAAYALRALNGTSALAANVVSPLAEFPPAAMTGATTSLTGYSFGGGGSYAATASSSSAGPPTPNAWNAFDKVAGSGVSGYWHSSALYSNTTGIVTSATTLGGYAGEWLKIQLPSQIYKTYYSLQARTDIATQNPYTWVLLGSTDNSTWTLLTSHTAITWTAGQVQTFNVNSTVPYNYYALVINAVPAQSSTIGPLVTSIGEWRIYGTTFQDFYALPTGLLTTAASGAGTTIAAWGGANTTPGNVLTWYDQSGLSRHVTQTTASLQPRITQTAYGPGYMIQFNGTAQYLQNTAFSYNFNTGSYNYTISAQVSNNTGGVVVYKGVAGLLWSSAGAKKWWLGANSINEALAGNYPNIVGNSEGYVLANTPIPSTGAPAVVTWSSTSFLNAAIYENGTSVPVTYNRAVQYTDPGTVLAIGGGGTGPYYNGNMFELLVFSTNLESYPPAATTIYQNEFSYLSPMGILSVQGNAFVSNAVTTTNVYATTSANVLTLNTGSIFTTATGFLGVGTSAPSGTRLYVVGNVYASISLAAPNVQALTMNVTDTANTQNFRMGTGQFLGIGGVTPTGNALEVSGNAFFSNAVRATNVFATTSANVTTLNTLSIFTRNSFLGIGTSAASGTSLYVQGNVYASNAISTPAVFTPAANVAATGNAATVTTGTAGVGGGASAATLTVTGNLFASNAVTTTNITATSANVSSFANVATLSQIPSLAVGTASGVRGNVFVSNSLTTTNVFAISVNTATMNTLSIAAPVRVGMAGYSGPWSYIPFNGTLVDSIGNLTNPVSSGTLTYTTTNGPGGGPTLVAAPSSYPLWTMSSLINVDNGLTVSLWVKFNTAYSASQDIFSGATVFNQGLNFSISSSKFILNFWTKPVVARTIINTTITPVIGEWYNLACTINNSKLITFYVNGVGVGSATYVNPGTTMGSSIWLNGPQQTATGEVEYASLQIYTADLTAREISTIYNLNAVSSSFTRDAIVVQNNLYASNALSTPNIVAASLNVASTLNVSSLTATLVVANALALTGSNLIVSNSITTTNLFATNVNAAQYVSLSVGAPVGTNGGATLTVQGNLASSNTLWSLPDVSAVTGLYYVHDITKRAPHLLPTPSNAATIQNWISATCNAVSQPTEGWWATSSAPSYGNVTAQPGYSGGVYLPDGRLLFAPSTTSNIGIYTPDAGLFSIINGAAPGFGGGVLLPNGNVVFAPQFSNVGMFNPVSYQFSNILQRPSNAYNAVLTSNGIAFTPLNAADSAVVLYTTTAVNVLTREGPYVPTQAWSAPTTSLKSIDSACTWRSIVWSAELGLFVAVGSGGSVNSAYSYDARTWTASVTTLKTVESATLWYSVAWNSVFGRFIAVGRSGTYNSAYSTDGINWYLTADSLGGGSNPWYVAANPDWPSFAAINQAGSIRYSEDGSTWLFATYSSFGTIPIWLAIGYGGGPYVAVGVGSGPGTFYSGISTDGGHTWTGTDLALQVEYIPWNGVAYSPSLGVWVAVSIGEGAGGTGSYKSAWGDGFNWNIPTTPLTAVDASCRWNSVTWSPEKAIFVAIGSSGTINSAYSPDGGDNWYAYPSVSSVDSSTWNGIAWSPSQSLFAAVGGSGSGYNSAYIYYPPTTYPFRSGSILLPSGNVLFAGQTGTSNMMLFDPVSLSQSNIVVGTSAYSGLVLGPNGNVVAVPSESNACIINPSTATSTNVVTGGGFDGGVLLPSGNVIFIPKTATAIGLLDPVSLAYSSFGSATGFSGGTLLTSGQVVFTPGTATSIGVLETEVPVSQEFCLSPYFNHGP
jgi:hypothetical protein